VALRADQGPNGNDPVHPNTHASMLADPTSTDTSTPTQVAFRDHGILDALLNGLLHPVPHGADGETEGDLDFEEKVVS
jgi:hsp70-interacting protein